MLAVTKPDDVRMARSTAELRSKRWFAAQGMRGTHDGSCSLHVSPEGAIGGPLALALALVRSCDLIERDVEARRQEAAAQGLRPQLGAAAPAAGDAGPRRLRP